MVFAKSTCAEKVDVHAFSGTYLQQVSEWYDREGAKNVFLTWTISPWSEAVWALPPLGKGESPF